MKTQKTVEEIKVTRIETLRCDVGWRMFSNLKVMTDEGLIGWSECNESFGSHGLYGVSMRCCRLS